VLDASAALVTPGTADAMKNPMSPAPAITKVVTQARRMKVRIEISFRFFDWLLLSCSCDIRSLKFEQDG
jgi:hypothetical protein